MPIDFVAGVAEAVVASKREILMGLASGVFFALAMLLCRPVLRWKASRSGVRRLLYSEILGRASTWALMGLAFGLHAAAVLVLLQPHPVRGPSDTWATDVVVILLFLLGAVALSRISTRAAERLAKQVIEQRTPTPS